jgi:hypothetical protein
MLTSILNLVTILIKGGQKMRKMKKVKESLIIGFLGFQSDII